MYCYISKSMACLDCNISSEKRLITPAVERRCTDEQNNKKEGNSSAYEFKTMLLLIFASIDILLLLIKLEQILCSFILQSDLLSL